MSEPPLATRWHQMYNEWLMYHQAYPELWDLFQTFALEIAHGQDHSAVKLIMARIREETDFEYKNGEDFKVNDKFNAYYARAFMYKYPEFDGFFTIRNQRSKKEPPTNLDPLGPGAFPSHPLSAEENQRADFEHFLFWFDNSPRRKQ